MLWYVTLSEPIPSPWKKEVLLADAHEDFICAHRASMIWIIGEYAERIDNADELLESFLEGFHDENTQVQLQLLTAIVKLFLKRPTDTQELVQQVRCSVMVMVLQVCGRCLCFPRWNFYRYVDTGWPVDYTKTVVIQRDETWGKKFNSHHFLHTCFSHTVLVINFGLSSWWVQYLRQTMHGPLESELF